MFDGDRLDTGCRSCQRLQSALKHPLITPLAQPPNPKCLTRCAPVFGLNYSIRTEDTYVDWVRRFVLFHARRHPRDMGAAEIAAFLTHLAVVGKVSASAQNQAKSALLFLYRAVLGIDLPWLTDVASARQGKRLPVVLTVVALTVAGTPAKIAACRAGA